MKLYIIDNEGVSMFTTSIVQPAPVAKAHAGEGRYVVNEDGAFFHDRRGDSIQPTNPVGWFTSVEAPEPKRPVKRRPPYDQDQEGR